MDLLLLANRGRIFIAALLMTALADFCLYGAIPVGWCAGLILMLFFVLLLPRDHCCWRNPRTRLWATATVLTAGSLVIEPGRFNIFFGIVFLILFRFSQLGLKTITATAAGLLTFPATMMLEWVNFRKILPKSREPEPGRKSLLWQIGVWILPVFFAVVFLIFFSVANPVITKGIREFFSFFFRLNVPEAGRVFFWLLFFAFAAAIMLMEFAGKTAMFEGALQFLREFFGMKPLAVSEQQSSLLASIMTRALVLFNLIFLVQNALDIEYLWMGAKLPEGMTYAEYAHRGAYPLIISALLAEMLVLIAFSERRCGPAWIWPKRLVYCWLGQNIFLVGSSLLRLNKYVDVYALSYWRVAAALWMLLTALSLALLIWKIRANKSFHQLIEANIVLLTALTVFLCYADLPGFIAGYNVRHCSETAATTADGITRAALDRKYLSQLGIGALQARKQFRESDPAFERDLGALLRANRSWRSWCVRNAARERELQTQEKSSFLVSVPPAGTSGRGSPASRVR